MSLNPSNPIVRYTPPTCILEVYNKNLFSLPVNPESNANKIHFQLHFDDPRLPQEEKETINGDRNLLLNLRDEINSYISDYLRQKTINPNRENNQELASNNHQEKNKIALTKQGLCKHQLHLSTKKNKIINLSNTQLFDLANALENYHQQSAQIHKQYSRNFWRKLSLTIGFLGIFALLAGLWWWRNEQQIAQQANQSQQQLQETDSDSNPINNVGEVIPPSAIDSGEVPEVIIPEETEAMKKRETLPPPPPTLTQPPIIENQEQNTNTTTLVNNNLENETARVAPVNATPEEILPPPSSPPLPPPPPVTLAPPENQVIAINNGPETNTESISPPSLPPSSQIQTISPQTRQNQTPPRLENRLPVLESSNQQFAVNDQITNNSANNQTEINSVAINQSPNLTLPPQSTTTTIAKTSSSTNNYLVTEDVKQYFQGKWQPPDNLQQSIEYRLLINENGSLSRIVPLGQSAQIFLDVTGMPLLGQTLSSSAQGSVTVRLILSPDGEVRTFQE